MPVTRALGRPGSFTEAPVTATDLVRQRVSSSPALAADPTAPRFVVAAHRTDGPERGCGLQVSGDGGGSWAGASPVPVLPPGTGECYAPEVAFDGRGTLHYLFVGLAGPGMKPTGAFLTTSTDRARTFSPPLRVLGPLSYGVRMVIDGVTGRIHLAWLQAGAEPTATGFTSLSNPVMTAHSDDDGASFSEPVMVSTPTGRLAGPALAVGPGGRVEVAYYDLGDDARDYEGQAGLTWEGRWSLLVATSSDGGGRFGPGVVVDDAILAAYRVPSIFTMAPPALVAGPQGTCLAWTDARHGDADVLLRCRSGGGRWGSVRRVNDDPQGNGTWQYLPQLALAPTGRLDVAFYDRRISSSLRNDRATVAFAYSYDGRQFSSNIALTHAFFDPAVGPVAGPAGTADFGSRLGLLSQDSSALAAWTDARNGRKGVVTQDVYSAQATLLFASVRPQWAVPAGAALAAASVGAMALLRRRNRQRHEA